VAGTACRRARLPATSTFNGEAGRAAVHRHAAPGVPPPPAGEIRTRAGAIAAKKNLAKDTARCSGTDGHKLFQATSGQRRRGKEAAAGGRGGEGQVAAIGPHHVPRTRRSDRHPAARPGPAGRTTPAYEMRRTEMGIRRTVKVAERGPVINARELASATRQTKISDRPTD